MKVDTNRLSCTERARRLATGLYLYCGVPGHFTRVCPSRSPHPALSDRQLKPAISTLPLIMVQLLTPRNLISVPALMDSGSSGNFISQTLLKMLDFPRQRQAEMKIKTIQGKPLGRGHIKFQSPPSSLGEDFLSGTGGTHRQCHPGTPLAISTFPEVRWDTSEILRWSKTCIQKGLTNVPVTLVSNLKPQVHSTLVESPEPCEVLTIPSDYTAFQDVFSKQAAMKLQPHRPWDCAIDLQPGAILPKGRVYPLSIPESKAMEDYIKELLQQQLIRPSTSPAASSFFFMSKKDGGFWPCFDYLTLNDDTVKLPYPLLLVPAALGELRAARIFSKLDLWSAYKLVCIQEGDKWKMVFIAPSGHYEYRVMPYGLSSSSSIFQGFMNKVFREFLHRFVIVYVENILINSRNLAKHRPHVTQVLRQLRKHHLYLKLEKCVFHRPMVKFLGYILSVDGIRMDQGKVQAIRDWQ